MIARFKRIPRIGKRAFLPPTKKLPPGNCTWCGEWFIDLDQRETAVDGSPVRAPAQARAPTHPNEATPPESEPMRDDPATTS